MKLSKVLEETRDKKSDEFVRKYARQLPGMFDYNEGIMCYQADFDAACEELLPAIFRHDLIVSEFIKIIEKHQPGYGQELKELIDKATEDH